MIYFFARRAFIVTLCGIMPGCMEPPTLRNATAGVQVGDVVERVKCELADAFAARIRDPYFAWMQDWTARIDLTLQANQGVFLTPGGTYTKNFRNAFNFDAGPTTALVAPPHTLGATVAAIPQSFSLAGGAAGSEQANRTETISFSLSLKELQAWRDAYRTSTGPDPCPPPEAAGIDGNLGLSEWVDASLEPVVSGRLQAGYHPAPFTSAKPASVVAAAAPAAFPRGAATGLCDSNDEKKLRGSIKASVVNACKDILLKTGLAGDQEDAAARCDVPAHGGQQEELGDNDELDRQRSRYNAVDEGLIARLKNTQINAADLGRQEKALEFVLMDMYKKGYNQSWSNFFSEAYNKYSGLKSSINRGSIFSKVLSKKRNIEALYSKAEGLTGVDELKKICIAANDLLAGNRGDIAKQIEPVEGILTLLNKYTEKNQAFFNISKDLESSSQNSVGYITAFNTKQKNIDDDLTTAKGTLPDPPLDVLSHSVQFTIAFGAGINPIWTLAAFKGPGGSGNLISASGNHQHTLNLALGPTNKKGDADRILNNLAIAQAFRQ